MKMTLSDHARFACDVISKSHLTSNPSPVISTANNIPHQHLMLRHVSPSAMPLLNRLIVSDCHRATPRSGYRSERERQHYL
ncbi:hypothetical protein DOTSEDRAFT_75270 [Dothistroma septosporum NZE10]|uniref:Uncharacterized protein n=1 Tax=Dothistroma septosporum (strain NZE10 / CBS 128990) TaxID=675120 RepID=M2YKP7_DOTSN|nr:hypothetical protein DOTSEDRAFT_75270 [Dothistroma septosporum NZE10]